MAVGHAFSRLVVVVCLGSLLAGQVRPPRKKPVLIRADRTTEATAEPEIVSPDPLKARKHVEVGDFYFKKKNYEAATERYRDAIKYNRKWPKAYQKLIRTLEKRGEFPEAVEVCREFIQQNPDSKEAPKFRKKADKLEARLEAGRRIKG